MQIQMGSLNEVTNQDYNWSIDELELILTCIFEILQPWNRYCQSSALRESKIDAPEKRGLLGPTLTAALLRRGAALARAKRRSATALVRSAAARWR